MDCPACNGTGTTPKPVTGVPETCPLCGGLCTHRDVSQYEIEHAPTQPLIPTPDSRGG
jgi:DnaJ-class molecular chaperone